MKHNDKFLTTNKSNGELFDPFFEDFFEFPFKKNFRELENIMKTDVKETESNYEIEVDLPGFDKKDVSISLNDGYLTISAKKENSTNESEHKYIRRERCYGSCQRSFYVGDIDESEINAKLENGILTISLPKEDKKINAPKNIEIK